MTPYARAMDAYFTEPTSLREYLILLAAGVLVLLAILGGIVAVLSWWTA